MLRACCSSSLLKCIVIFKTMPTICHTFIATTNLYNCYVSPHTHTHTHTDTYTQAPFFGSGGNVRTIKMSKAKGMAREIPYKNIKRTRTCILRTDSLSLSLSLSPFIHSFDLSFIHRSIQYNKFRNKL